MRTVLVCVVMSVVATSAGAAPGQAAPGQDVATRARGAQSVVVGSVVDVVSRFATTPWGDQIIVSTAAVDVRETLKGRPHAVLHVTVEGGTVGALTLTVSDLPAVKTGDRAVMFLDETASGHVPHGRGTDVFLPLDRGNRVRGTLATLDEIRATVRAAAK